jgi:hypothetical protein
MKKTRVNINSVYNSVYSVIMLGRKYSMASNEKILQTKILFNVCKFVNEIFYFLK